MSEKIVELQKALNKFPKLPSGYGKGSGSDVEKRMFEDLCEIDAWQREFRKKFAEFRKELLGST